MAEIFNEFRWLNHKAKHQPASETIIRFSWATKANSNYRNNVSTSIGHEPKDIRKLELAKPRADRVK